MAIVIGKMNEHYYYYKQWNFGEPNFETTPYDIIYYYICICDIHDIVEII